MKKAIRTKAIISAIDNYESAYRQYDFHRKYGHTNQMNEWKERYETAYQSMIAFRKPLDDAIKEAEARATVRKIEAKDIINQIAYIEKKLNIPKKYLDGTKITVDCNAQSFSSAYKYVPESTIFTAENKAGEWRITDIYRGQCGKQEYSIKLSDIAKATLINRFENGKF